MVHPVLTRCLHGAISIGANATIVLLSSETASPQRYCNSPTVGTKDLYIIYHGSVHKYDHTVAFCLTVDRYFRGFGVKATGHG